MARGFGRQRAALKRLRRPATKSVGVDLAGVEDLVKDLARLNRQFGPLISRRMISAALRTMATGVRRRISGQTFGAGRSPERLRKSIGYRHLKKARKNEHLGKVGFRVGGRKKALAAHHAHLYVLGTGPRTRRRIGGKFKRYDSPINRGTGAAPAHDRIIPDAVAASINNARRAMLRTGQRELDKQRRRGRSRRRR